jgi:hypothetical protein
MELEHKPDAGISEFREHPVIHGDNIFSWKEFCLNWVCPAPEYVEKCAFAAPEAPTIPSISPSVIERLMPFRMESSPAGVLKDL